MNDGEGSLNKAWNDNYLWTAPLTDRVATSPGGHSLICTCWIKVSPKAEVIGLDNSFNLILQLRIYWKRN